MERNIEKGTLGEQIVYCPATGLCPYFENGICHVGNQLNDCPDWYDYLYDYEERKGTK